jgi:ABC-type molybdenum transport system ATPase subunit/photorepair protein PhrA
MFDEVASDTTTMLSDLAEEIAREYGALVGDDRAATLSDLDPMKGRVQDRSGVLRTVGSLSQGTRDSFVLASRLVLAERAISSPGILLFDEAFAALDLERRSRALALLRRFREEHGWQLVIFTMDPGLAEEVQDGFPGAVVHELTPEDDGKRGQAGDDAAGAGARE